MVTHLSKRRTQFLYFDHVLAKPEWKGKKILDFGGNVGGFLAGAGDHVDHADYWCLDITEGAIAQGRHDFPRANFVFYNRYASYFNPDGVRYLPVPDLGLQFDIILAFSVFTHTHRDEMVDLVDQLRRMLVKDGLLAFTFCDPCYDRSLSDPTLAPGTGVLTMETDWQPSWCADIDDRLDLEPGNELCQQERRGKPGDRYSSYFTPRAVALTFPGARVYPPVSPEWQHCCVLGSHDSTG
jgi:SAM-dependent methyltransferase